MLGNNADQFMTTPMPTSITTQARSASAREMPAPRPTARVGMENSFLPGIGEGDMLPGMGESDMLPGMGQMAGGPRNLLLLGAAGLSLWFFFLRKPARNGGSRKKRGKTKRRGKRYAARA